jgi:hypothetical protein
MNVRFSTVAVALVVIASLCTSCSANAAHTDPLTPRLDGYEMANGNYVYWMQLNLSNRSRVVGVLEELLGPAVSPDQQIDTYVYHLTGSVEGSRMTYKLETLTPKAPNYVQTLSSSVSPQAVTLGVPLVTGGTIELHKSTQHLYDLVARSHALAWKPQVKTAPPQT